jgi:type IV pilus assembly protein PilV
MADIKMNGLKTGGKQGGFTLLEVLIALLVLSIGLLGLAALQTLGMRSNQMAGMRTLATHYAYDMTDRMRANPEGVDANQYVFTFDPNNLPTYSKDCRTSTCTPAEMADFDITLWINALVGTLPSGRGSISQTVTAGVTTHTVTLFWDEERTGATGTNCGPDYNLDLRCIQFTL